MDFNDVVERARQGFDVVAKKTEDVVNISKLKLEKASLESKLSKSYEILGKLCYDAVKDDDDFDAESAKPVIDDITEKIGQIKKINRDIIATQNKKQCANCGNGIDKDSVFCNKCGAKVN